MLSSTRATLRYMSGFLRTFREEIWLGPEKSKSVLKIAKIKGYNTRFRTFLGSELGTPQDAS